MPARANGFSSSEAVRLRAAELALTAENKTTEDSEMLAAFADGTLSLDDLPDSTLETHVARFGTDLPVAPGTAKKAPSSFIAYWMAAAAAVLFICGASFLWRVYGPQQPGSLATPSIGRDNHGSPRNSASVPNSGPRPTVDWTPQVTFDAMQLKRWALRPASLPRHLPNFNRGQQTLGANSVDRFTQWRLATVIVRSQGGWGSGALITADGLLLTNYHVVAGAAQAAALTGQPAVLDVIRCQLTEGKIKPLPANKAVLYRADPVHDLALLKLTVPPGRAPLSSFFSIASQIQAQQDCFVIGSQSNGPAWWVRGGTVSQQFDYPEDLSQFAAGATSSGASVDRDRATVVITDTRISPGDSGGPLLNADGELIGLTFATPANRTAGSVGWHIALQHLRAFTHTLPRQPEPVPFDIWTAGLPASTLLEPALLDGDEDNRVDTLLYRYSVPSQGDPSTSQGVAYAAFVDFAQRSTGRTLADKFAFGLWGDERRGHFRFDLVVIARADQRTVVGYTNANGIVDQIRIGSSSQSESDIIWRRNTPGLWNAEKPDSPAPLFDRSLIGDLEVLRLQRILNRIQGGQPERGSQRPARKPVPGPPE